MNRGDASQTPPFIAGRSSEVYTNQLGSHCQTGDIELHRRSTWYCLRFREIVDVFFQGPQQAVWYAQPEVSLDLLSALLTGPLLALLLELQGVVCLHASAVQMAGNAVAFIGLSGAGKTSLAAMLIGRGHALVTDDILPLALDDERCLAIPSFPQLKLPPGAHDLIGLSPPDRRDSSDTTKRLVAAGQGWDAFVAGPLPLDTVYVLRRDPQHAGAAEITPFGPAAGLLELLRFSFCARVVEVLGLQPPRMAFLGETARRLRIRELRYASGWSHLPQLHSALLADCDQ